MTKNIIEKFLSYARFIFYEILSPNFNTASLKSFIDYAYIILEKIAYSFDILSSNYLQLYDELVEKEIKMAQISNKSNILIIGCGSLPATTILISIKTKANIISIDYDKKAIQKANNFIKNCLTWQQRPQTPYATLFQVIVAPKWSNYIVEFLTLIPYLLI